MKERVYLSDWLYNAGIIGFLKIVTNDDIDSENSIEIGENYIEFDRSALQGFSSKYFSFAFNQYGRYYNILNTLEEFLSDLDKLEQGDSNVIHNLRKKYKISDKDKDEEILQVILDRFKKILNGFKFLKENIKLPSKEEIKEDPKKAIKGLLEFAIKVMKDEYQEIFESDVQIYLRGMYGQKSFLNLTINKERLKKFYEDFEEPIVSGKIDHEKELFCVNCGRQAKKGAKFDTGISPFFGLNDDAINYAWNFDTSLPLCEICELIYFSSFAGLTPSPRNDKTFYFVNEDSSVRNLYRANKLLNDVLKKDNNENFLVDFFTELVLELEREKAEFVLKNIALIELNLSEENFPKVYSFNVSREKARFIKENQTDLKTLARASYKVKDQGSYILTDTIQKILKNTLDYGYLYWLERISLSEQGKSNLYQIFFGYETLQTLNILIFRFLKNITKEGRKLMSLEEKEIWRMYACGKELADVMKSRNAENKIPSIAYKLLNALKIGDVNVFMDVAMRTFMAYDMEVPSSMAKVLYNKEYFYPLGYSFLNGFLSKGGNNKGNVQETKEVANG
ncbi:MAG: type I-B CRISPR-associated protein Cas8b1/Cst1 [Caldisericum sp.]|jgi:CRISPR-associated protein Cst1|nr:type I-B CRISPR-associated protein Cas8b1/Cst1 [Caldisericum sp.]